MASQAKPRSFKSSKSSKRRPTPSKPNIRTEKRKQLQEYVKKLQESVDAFDPKAADAIHFSDLPLSEPTSTGLQASHFQDLTDIQAGAIPLALKGSDILGAAKTGSGKTLAFLIPVLEKLYRAKWTEFDGLGALIISPTRELAVQIFEVLRKVGRNHAFSAGLVIGGKNLKEEAERLARMNILVCTPGRMLQHLDQTAGLDVDNLQILVLDEADRIMDMGFQPAVDALVEHLPKGRQTLMFSATQSKRLSDLARLSLKDPEYVAVHEAAKAATPGTLQQHYIVTPLPEKLETLYGFIKANLKSKIIVFLSSGKQVRFVYESFRNMQPGIPLLHLHGRQKQMARFEITSRFTSAQHSCLLATDVVARGVDFPAVDWVIQADCPEDTDTYIHRVGRTARYERAGRAVLFLDPSEEQGMLRKLEQRKVPIQKVGVKESKKRSIKDQLQVLCFQKPDLKYLAQKAFVSYTRSVHLQRDKDVFKFNELDLDGFAASMGLPGTPQIRYQKGEDVKTLKNAPRGMLSSDCETDSSSDDDDDDTTTTKKTRKKKKPEVRTKYDRMFERTNQDVLSSHYTKMIGDDGGDDEKEEEEEEEEAFLSVKRRLPLDDGDGEQGNAYDKPDRAVKMLGGVPFVVDSKRREKMLKSKKQMLKFTPRPEKIVFDDDGKPRSVYEMKTEEDFRQEGAPEDQRIEFLKNEATKVREADLDDKEMARQRKKEKRAKRKAREALEMAEPARAVAPALAGGEDPLALMRSLPLNQGGSDSDSDEPPRKKSRKWFEKDSDGEEAVAKKRRKGGRKVLEIDHEPEGIEDLEALAAGLLDD